MPGVSYCQSPSGGKRGCVVQNVAQRAVSPARNLLEEVGVPIGRTVIGGFSQGCVMSYAVGLGVGRPVPAGILGLSGFVPTVEECRCGNASGDGKLEKNLNRCDTFRRPKSRTG